MRVAIVLGYSIPLLLCLWVFGGCAAIGSRMHLATSGLPAYSTAITVENKTSDTIEVSVDRLGLGAEPVSRIAPGNSDTVAFGNSSDQSTEVRMIARRIRGNKIDGVASQRFSVSGYYADSPNWEVRDDDFK